MAGGAGQRALSNTPHWPAGGWEPKGSRPTWERCRQGRWEAPRQPSQVTACPEDLTGLTPLAGRATYCRLQVSASHPHPHGAKSPLNQRSHRTALSLEASRWPAHLPFPPPPQTTAATLLSAKRKPTPRARATDQPHGLCVLLKMSAERPREPRRWQMGTQEKSKARSQEAINASSRKGLVCMGDPAPSLRPGVGAWRTPPAALEGPSATCHLPPPPRTAMRPSVNSLHPQDSYGHGSAPPPRTDVRERGGLPG